MIKPALSIAAVYCLVGAQAVTPFGKLVAGPGFEGVIIPSSQYDHGTGPVWAVRDVDVREAESRLPAYIASSEAGAVLQGSRVPSELANYKRQYWGLMHRGQRQLLITFIHRTSGLADQWRTAAILIEGGGYPSSTGIGVQGGGERHFRVSYSIDAQRFSGLQLNSPF